MHLKCRKQCAFGGKRKKKNGIYMALFRSALPKWGGQIDIRQVTRPQVWEQIQKLGRSGSTEFSSDSAARNARITYNKIKPKFFSFVIAILALLMQKGVNREKGLISSTGYSEDQLFSPSITRTLVVKNTWNAISDLIAVIALPVFAQIQVSPSSS